MMPYMPPYWLEPEYETGSDTDSDSEPSRPCTPVPSSEDHPQAIRENLSERHHAARQAKIDQRRSVRVKGQLAPHRVAAESSRRRAHQVPQRRVNEAAITVDGSCGSSLPLSNHSAETHSRKRPADRRDDDARVAKRLKPSPAPPLGSFEEYTKFGEVVIGKFRIARGNPICGIPGCNHMLAPTDVEAVRKHIREHYRKGKENEVVAAPTGSKNKGKGRAVQFKCLVKGCKDQDQRDLASIVRHSEMEHLGWKYRCLAKGCARESNRWDVLHKHMTELAGEKAHKTQAALTKWAWRIDWNGEDLAYYSEDEAE
ncbi:hypothetical protein C8Q74DRAFT_334213 [Fomes fomentarius]|nr:hypothetical protein C8Q74DRAFT_334213 [Fomes fomentarius]